MFRVSRENRRGPRVPTGRLKDFYLGFERQDGARLDERRGRRAAGGGGEERREALVGGELGAEVELRGKKEDVVGGWEEGGREGSADRFDGGHPVCGNCFVAVCRREGAREGWGSGIGWNERDRGLRKDGDKKMGVELRREERTG